jgi:hypothetical protein
MTSREPAAAGGASPSADEAAARCRSITRSASAHPADWGRAIALALEYLAVQVAFTVRKPELGILVGRDVRLRFEPNGDGVVIEASLEHPTDSRQGGAHPHHSQGTAMDGVLEERVTAALEACEGIDTTNVVISAVPGGVILRGSLVSVDDRNTVVHAVLRVAGVTSVGDELDVPQPHYGQH